MKVRLCYAAGLVRALDKPRLGGRRRLAEALQALWAACLALACVLVASSAHGQDFGFIDANGLPAQGPDEAFFSMPSGGTRQLGTFAVALRSSVLLEPVSGSQPSPDPDGTDTAVVSCVGLHEILLAAGVGAGIDVTLALPLHLPQSGQALTGVGIGDELAPVALGDLRVGVGAGFAAGAWKFGPRATVYVPTGEEQEFAGERLPRGELGMAASWTTRRWTIGGWLAARIRETSEIGNTRWSSQAIVAVGTRVTLSPVWDAGLELMVAPTLGGQPTPPSGSAGFLLPAEVLLGAHRRLDALVVGALLSTGLPISVASGSGDLVRGPTSPILRFGLEVGASF